MTAHRTSFAKWQVNKEWSASSLPRHSESLRPLPLTVALFCRTFLAAFAIASHSLSQMSCESIEAC